MKERQTQTGYIRCLHLGQQNRSRAEDSGFFSFFGFFSFVLLIVLYDLCSKKCAHCGRQILMLCIAKNN